MAFGGHRQRGDMNVTPLVDEGHGIVRRGNRIAYLARVVRFLDEHL
jgi:dipeptidyl aminopeptidase/acylaminoacyl peptidase